MSRSCPRCGTTFEDSVFFCGNDGTITVEVQDPNDFDRRLGTQLGGYIVVARVADGAMGRVYEGRDPQTKQRVAIKVLHAEVARDNIAVERFKREFETANGFNHPNIVKVLEFGQTPDRSHFLTMEYLEGEELEHALRRERTLPMDRTVRVLSQAALALEHAHSYGVIHRDLKPGNIFLCRSPDGDSVRILDFGSVKLQMELGPKLTAFGTTLGSPYYMSPEQAMGKQDVDHRTDVFALAAITFEMLTGKIAFEGSSIADILMSIVTGPTPSAHDTNREVPLSVSEVVERGICKDKTKRFESTTAFATALGNALGLGGDAALWATSSQARIREQLSVSTPSLPAPRLSPLLSPNEPSLPPPAPSKAPIVIGLAFVAILVVCALVGAALLLAR